MKTLSSIPKSNCPHCGSILDEPRYSEGIPVTKDMLRAPLTFREQQLVDLVKQAKSNKEIAYELSLTVGSVKEYMHRVFKKVGVRSRLELALWKESADTHSPGDTLV